MLTKLQRYNTLRNQILAIYLAVMLIVLLIVGAFIFSQLGPVMKTNAEKQMHQTAVEANGRMETLYKQIDTLTNQVATNNTVQQLLTDVVERGTVSVPERQSLVRVINNFHAYSNAISAFYLYTLEGTRMYPYDGAKLLNKEWVEKADREKGRLVWIGKDQSNPEYSFVIRKVNLMERSFSGGGYLLVRVHNSHFQVNTSDEQSAEGYMMLLDRDYSPITSNYDGDLQQILQKGKESVWIEKMEYLVVREKSEVTGWTLVVLMPMSVLMKGVSVVRTSILFSGMIGVCIFLIASLFLSAIITRPIFRLTRTMKRALADDLKPNAMPHPLSTNEILDLNATYNEMIESISHLIQQVYEKELLHSRAELKALQSQIDPHFLYNTLNALYWALEDKGEEELADQVIAMSELFRYTIGKTDHDEVTVGEELEHIERYLQIMKMRMGNRLLWEVSAPTDCLHVRIPKLIIQPLVENALVHGIGNQREQGIVSIRVQRAEHTPCLIVTVSDNGAGIEAETLRQIHEWMENGGVISSKGTGIAIANVNKRLSLFYGHAGNVKVKSEIGRGTEVTFEIPSKGA